MTATFFFANYDAGPCKRDGSIYVNWVHFRESRINTWIGLGRSKQNHLDLLDDLLLPQLVVFSP